MQAEIKAVVENELEQLVHIEAVCFPLAEAAGRDQIYERFATFGENFFTAQKDGKIIGFVNGCTAAEPVLPDALYHNTSLHRPQGAWQTVFGLDVLPKYRRQGVAAQLLNHLIAVSRSRGKKGIVLTCKDRLIPYYEQFGFNWRGKSDSEHGRAQWNDMLLRF